MLKFTEYIKEYKYEIGNIVIPKTGPHKGVKHEVIHVFDDGSMNIKPKLNAAIKNRYRHGAAKAKPNEVTKA